MIVLLLAICGADSVTPQEPVPAVSNLGSSTEDPWPFGPFGQARHDENETQLRSAQERLTGKRPEDLAKLVLETLSKAKDLRGATEPGAVRERDALPWMECAAAIRILGKTREKRWVGIFQDGFTLEGAPLGFSQSLLNEASWAWLRIEGLDGMKGSAAIKAVRSNWSAAAGRVQGHAHYLLFAREFSNRGWAPDIVALFDDPNPRVRTNILAKVKRDAPEPIKDRRVNALADPDPGIRERQARAFRASPKPYLEYWKRQGYEGTGFAPALGRFAVRPDIPDDARSAAAEALAVRGYGLKHTADGWVVFKSAPPDKK